MELQEHEKQQFNQKPTVYTKYLTLLEKQCSKKKSTSEKAKEIKGFKSKLEKLLKKIESASDGVEIKKLAIEVLGLVKETNEKIKTMHIKSLRKNNTLGKLFSLSRKTSRFTSTLNDIEKYTQTIIANPAIILETNKSRSSSSLLREMHDDDQPPSSPGERYTPCG